MAATSLHHKTILTRYEMVRSIVLKPWSPDSIAQAISEGKYANKIGIFNKFGGYPLKIESDTKICLFRFDSAGHTFYSDIVLCMEHDDKLSKPMGFKHLLAIGKQLPRLQLKHPIVALDDAVNNFFQAVINEQEPEVLCLHNRDRSGKPKRTLRHFLREGPGWPTNYVFGFISEQ